MDATLERRLAALKNRATLYELTITNGTTTYLVAYSGRKGRTGIDSCVCNKNRVQKIIKLTGRDMIDYAKRAADGATMGAWKINFSGRTQREALIGGELPYVGDLEG